MDMRKLVGANLARLRERRGLTQEALSDASGLSQHYLSELERGKRNPTVITLYELAVALDAEVAEFLKPTANRARKVSNRGRPPKS